MFKICVTKYLAVCFQNLNYTAFTQFKLKTFILIGTVAFEIFYIPS